MVIVEHCVGTFVEAVIGGLGGSLEHRFTAQDRGNARHFPSSRLGYPDLSQLSADHTDMDNGIEWEDDENEVQRGRLRDTGPEVWYSSWGEGPEA